MEKDFELRLRPRQALRELEEFADVIEKGTKDLLNLILGNMGCVTLSRIRIGLEFSSLDPLVSTQILNPWIVWSIDFNSCYLTNRCLRRLLDDLLP